MLVSLGFLRQLDGFPVVSLWFPLGPLSCSSQFCIAITWFPFWFPFGFLGCSSQFWMAITWFPFWFPFGFPLVSPWFPLASLWVPMAARLFGIQN